MNHRVPVTELETAKSHGHPTFDVSGKKVYGAVFDHNFQVSVEKLQNEIEIRFR